MRQETLGLADENTEGDEIELDSREAIDLLKEQQTRSRYSIPDPPPKELLESRAAVRAKLDELKKAWTLPKSNPVRYPEEWIVHIEASLRSLDVEPPYRTSGLLQNYTRFRQSIHLLEEAVAPTDRNSGTTRGRYLSTDEKRKIRRFCEIARSKGERVNGSDIAKMIGRPAKCVNAFIKEEDLRL